MITLYHGSNLQVVHVDLAQCNPYKDFGQAFYLSADKSQAMRIAMARVDIIPTKPYFGHCPIFTLRVQDMSIPC